MWSGTGGCRQLGDEVRAGREPQWVRTRLGLQLLYKKLSDSWASPILWAQGLQYFRHHLLRHGRHPSTLFYNQIHQTPLHTDADFLEGGGERSPNSLHICTCVPPLHPLPSPDCTRVMALLGSEGFCRVSEGSFEDIQTISNTLPHSFMLQWCRNCCLSLHSTADAEPGVWTQL